MYALTLAIYGENFLITERLKTYANQGASIDYRFWKSCGGGGIDYLERETAKKDFKAFEFKYTRDYLSRGARGFSRTYQMPVEIVNMSNYHKFLKIQPLPARLPTSRVTANSCRAPNGTALSLLLGAISQACSSATRQRSLLEKGESVKCQIKNAKYQTKSK
ncbi:hypothetical protein B5M47_03190 [candidate division CPR3 bacterium 4484_211]|uniref:Uncharacterized protein n=1 Tax=candidate division CPR3 bacterium 4484_211 TaxID=1968527 RepID=A0A1W9NXM6_UNCC3|nr:MAG: hypothetical protein B5M47_03190 [candidate division CPR3 bacterium 4484_211]